MAQLNEYYFVILYYIAFFGLLAVAGRILLKIKCVNKFMDIILPIEEE